MNQVFGRECFKTVLSISSVEIVLQSIQTFLDAGPGIHVYTSKGLLRVPTQNHSTSFSLFEPKQIIWFTKNYIGFRCNHQNENSVIHTVPVILKKVLSHHNNIKPVEFICCLIMFI